MAKQIRNIGILAAEEFDNLDADWVVYHYNYESYEGDGEAAWGIGDKFYYKKLSHCSCYGPAETGYGVDDAKVPDNMEHFEVSRDALLSESATDSPIQNHQMQLLVQQFLKDSE